MSAAVAAKAASIDAAQARPLTWKSLVRPALLVAVAGLAIYLVLPKLIAVFGEIVLRADWPLATAGRAAQRLRNWVTRGRRPPVTGLDKRLLDQRDTIRGVLDRKWWQAAPLTAGRLGFDYGCLLVLAGVRAGYAVLAILAYRIASYWLPLLAGPPAYLLYRHRYGRPVFRRATDERKAGSPQ